MNKLLSKLLIILVLFTILTTACTRIDKSPVKITTTNTTTNYTRGEAFFPIPFNPSQDIRAKQFTDNELSAFAKAYRYQGYGYYNGRIVYSKLPESFAVMTQAQEGSPANDYSQTNVQVPGVDEADILKSDGTYIYTITGRTVYIIRAYPGEDAEKVSTIKFAESFSPEGMFLDDNYLAVFGNYYDNDFFREINIRPATGVTFFNIYDVSDKKNPRLIKEFKFEGSYLNARMHKGYVYFVVMSGITYRPLYPGPVFIEGETIKSIPARNVYYYNIPYYNPEFVTIHSISMKSQEKIDSKAIAVESSQTMYMSPENIYIAYTQYINEYEVRQEIMAGLLQDRLSTVDKELIARIQATDDEILSRDEKKSKIWQVYESYISLMNETERNNLEDETDRLFNEKMKEYEHLEFTVFTKVGVSNGNITIEGTGKVPGHLNNQFAMDEKDKNLRVATTLSERWNSKLDSASTNNVYVLDEDMNVIGKLEGLAETEQIYSTRFIDDRLYMVTFRQVDPFFVIDLSDPRNPVELGSLKIPGFSRYLHPYDKDIVIGIGQDASETGRIRGLKISLFDVSDVSKPKEIAKFITEDKYAQSTALWEHKAFLFSKEKNLLVIPAYSQEYRPWGESSASYNGAFVFKITKDSIELRGLIDHSNNNMYWQPQVGQPQVERSMYINELLYTKSPRLLRINRIDDLSSVKNITLESPDTSVPVY